MFDDFANRQIGDFIVQERLGRGAMSVVYRAVQQSVNRSVALKIINLNLNPLAKENYQPYFIQEAKVIATLEHIHIVPIYHYGPVDEESSFIVLRLLRGGSVADLLRDGPVDLYRALDIFIQVGQGLAHAHGRGIIHRDLKPSNILLDDLGNAYLTDFGLGKLAEVSLDLTESGNVIGTPLYASPEQLLGDEIDHRTDIYSMCAIMYHMLTGSPPLDIGDGGLIELLQKHMHERPLPLRELNPAIPPEIDDAIMSGLSRSAGDRPDSVEALANALNVTLGRRISRSSEPSLSVPEAPESTGLPAAPARRRLFVVAGLLLLVALAGVTMVVLGRPPRTLQLNVREGERGSMEHVAPSPEQVEAARAVLGSASFIAYIACTFENEYQVRRAEIMGERLEEYGIGFRSYDSRLDRYRQLTLIERARVEGAKALVLCILDSPSLHSSLEAAQRAGIPLIFTAPYDPRYGGVLIDMSDRELGMTAGAYAASLAQAYWAGAARVLLLEYHGLFSSELRVAGIEAALAQSAPDTVIVQRSEAATVSGGQAAVAAALEAGLMFDMVIAINDAAALGAARALQMAGVGPSDILIVSINGEEAARQMIRDGNYLAGTVETDLVGSSRMAVDAAVRLLGGGDVPEYITSAAGTIFTRDMVEVTVEP